MTARGVRLAAILAAALLLVVPDAPLIAAAAPEAPPAAVEAQALTLEFIDRAIAEGRLKDAAQLILRARARVDADELVLREAELMLAHGSLPQAATVFQSLEEKPLVAARALAGRGITAIRAGHPDEADVLLAAAVARDPGLARAWSARAVLADRRRDWEAADRFYARAIEAAPRSAEIHNNRGYSLLLRSRYPEAEAAFAEALAIDPKLAAAVTNLKLAKGLQGRYAEAFTGANREDVARDFNTIGVAAMLRGDHRVAESYFSRAIEMNSRYDRTASANLAYLKALDPTIAGDRK